MPRILSTSTANVTNYATFSEWHAANHAYYRTPTQAEIIQRDAWRYTYDEAADCFFYTMGEFAPVPGERVNVTWREMAEEYASMYQDFASYGTN